VRVGRRPGLQVRRELAALRLGEHVNLTAQEVDAGNNQTERLTLPQAQACAQGHSAQRSLQPGSVA
jgi:hypothetical protein